MKKYSKLTAWSILFLVSILLLTACGTLEVGIEHTASPDYATMTPRVAASPVLSTPTSQEGKSSAMSLIPPLAGLVYWVGSELWKVNVDGQPELIFAPDSNQAQYLSWRANVRISPSGEQVLYNDWETNDLWLVDLTTGLRRNLTNTPDANENFARWWPGRPDTLLFSSLPRELAPTPGWTGFLGVVGVDGGGYRILDDQRHVGGSVAPSPDGRTIAYGGGNTAWLYHWETGPEVFDPADYGLTSLGDSLEIGSPAWSPDEKRLAWIVVETSPSSDVRLGIGLFDLEAKTAQLLHSYEPISLKGWLPTPIWGPDGRLNMEGWLAPPLWSSDGRWLAFVTWSQNPVESVLWALRVVGEGEQEIPLVSGRIDGLTWSPDGRWLIFHHTTKELERFTSIVEVETWSRRQVDLPADAEIVDWLAPSSPSASMKGYELYSWQAEGEWRFALVIGTNRLKTYKEISSPGVYVQGLEAVKNELEQLPGGEQVFWSSQRVPNTTLPPDEVMDEIKMYCEQRGIQLLIGLDG